MRKAAGGAAKAARTKDAAEPIVVQRAVAARGLPSAASLKIWAAYARGEARGGITLRLVDTEEGLALNRDWRGRDYATNVLSFPFAEADFAHADYLGDVVICAPVVTREAAEQGKTVRAHWAHLVVHGVLHLQGHDHMDDAQAESMEAHERALLAALGFDDPYAADR